MTLVARAWDSRSNTLLLAVAGGALAVGAGIVLSLPNWSARDTGIGLVIALACVAALVAPARVGIAILVGYAGIAGFLKESANYAPAVHLSSDFVLASVVVAFVVRAVMARTLDLRRMPLRVVVGVLVGSALLLSFAPWTTPIQALGGWKAYVLPALLVPIAAAAYEGRGSMRALWVALVATGLANAVASFAERAIGEVQVATWGPGFLKVTLGAGTHAFANNQSLWRPFGLAQDAGTASGIEATGAIVLIALGVQRRGGRLAAFGAAAFLAAAVFLSGVRGAVVMLVAGVLVAAFLIRAKQGAASGTLIPVLALAAIAISGYGAIALTQPVTGARLGTLTTFDSYGSNRGILLLDIPSRVVSAPLGIGMGKVVPASDLLSSLAGVANEAVANENMALAMTLELGVFGLLFVVLFWAALTKAVLPHLNRRYPDPEMAAAVSISAAIFVVGFAGPVFMGQPLNLILWVLAPALAIRSAHHMEPLSE